MSVIASMAAYALPAASIWGIYSLGRVRSLARDSDTLSEMTEAGLIEPPTLHPSIDTDRCIGCKACGCLVRRADAPPAYAAEREPQQ